MLFSLYTLLYTLYMMTNLDESVSLLETLDPEDVDDIGLELQNWFGEVRDVLGVSTSVVQMN